MDKNLFSSLLRQELLANNLFLGASLNLCLSHTEKSIKNKTIKYFNNALDSFKEKRLAKNPEKFLKGDKIETVFKVR